MSFVARGAHQGLTLCWQRGYIGQYQGGQPMVAHRSRSGGHGRMAAMLLGAAVVGGSGGYLLSASDEPTEDVAQAAPQQLMSTDVYYRYCDDARAAGAAPIYRGEPGYRDALDADNDGVACEPYRGQ
ncbi:excalibur calcium-binding domain-containing protein [Aurantiacibacter gilvus]|uniref:Excalibur calcium-binding domain-containing protein n=1 Tax=Aurantiacibacter gilvus TaxID=3139141 RepID=A0ABU9IAI2_9SPHN